MNRTILSIFAIVLCFSIGHALQCYKCDLGFGSLCYTTTVTCQGSDQCSSGVGKAAGFVEIKIKECLPLAQCNKTTSINFPSASNTTLYQITKMCCNSDLCNAASALPRVTMLPLVLVSLTALFMTKVLV